MNINPIGFTTLSDTTFKIQTDSVSDKKTSNPVFKANYATILNEGKSLIEKDVSVSGFKKVLSFVKNKFHQSKEIPQLEKALLVYFTGLQTKKEFLDEVARKTSNNEYMDSNVVHTANILKKLENSNVVKSWELPDYNVMFNNGVLTDSAYATIRNKIKNADVYKLNDVQKRDMLNDLARSNYHTDDISYSLTFNGHSRDISPEDHEPISDIDIDDSGGGLFESFLNFLDDLF